MKVLAIDVIRERLAIMVALDIIPSYLFNNKLAMFSKNKTPIAETVKDIRPVGVLPVYWKLMEKTFKLIIEDKFPNMTRASI